MKSKIVRGIINGWCSGSSGGTWDYCLSAWNKAHRRKSPGGKFCTGRRDRAGRGAFGLGKTQRMRQLPEMAGRM